MATHTPDDRELSRANMKKELASRGMQPDRAGDPVTFARAAAPGDAKLYSKANMLALAAKMRRVD